MSKEFACIIPLTSDYDKIINGKKTFSGFEKVSGKTLLERVVEKVGSLPEITQVDLFTNIKSPFELNVSNCKWSIRNRPHSLNHGNISVEEIIESYLQTVESEKILYVSPRFQLLRRSSIQSCIDVIKTGQSQSAATTINNHSLSWFKDKPLNFSFAEKTPLVSEIENVMIETGGCYTFTRDHFEKYRKRVSMETTFIEIFKWESLEILNPNERSVVELLLDAGLGDERND